VVAGLLALTAGAALTACTSSSPQPNPAPSPTAPPVDLTITPANGAANIQASAEIGLKVSNGTIASVALTQSGGGGVAGTMRPDGTSWVPNQPLAYNTSYKAVVTARSADGKEVSRTTTFRTMPTPGNQDDFGMYLQQGEQVGVAMPIVLEFDPPVPDSARAAIQSRLFVTTTPAQPGVWHWASGRQVWYRAPEYWQPGTTISVRAALAGVPFGDGAYGTQDRSATVTVGQKVYMSVDNATKSMSVYQNDKLTRQIPVSLGKPSTPSSSGNMVTMSHDYTTIFDTTREGPGGYRVQVYYAMRLTWGGEFIHAAPWSVGDQGVDNVSHGCVNMSDENSKWLFGITHVGDPVTVKGTEVQLVDGNGWTAWNETWPQFVAGSALPVPAELANWTPPKPAAPVKPAPAANPQPTR
jgi:lipoprotein-anchoring transpeptidase ErfK/SrfK